jgi:threonyl-tRNA synthetase
MSQIKVTLPDGSVREIKEGATIYELAASIGAGLARAAVAGKLDGELADLNAPLCDGARVEIITDKNPEALEIIRHSRQSRHFSLESR